MNLSTLYNESELADHICPVALELAADKVAEVRQNAFHLVRRTETMMLFNFLLY